jgi:hypothetical protein
MNAEFGEVDNQPQRFPLVRVVLFLRGADA